MAVAEAPTASMAFGASLAARRTEASPNFAFDPIAAGGRRRSSALVCTRRRNAKREWTRRFCPKRRPRRHRRAAARADIGVVRRWRAGARPRVRLAMAASTRLTSRLRAGWRQTKAGSRERRLAGLFAAARRMVASTAAKRLAVEACFEAAGYEPSDGRGGPAALRRGLLGGPRGRRAFGLGRRSMTSSPWAVTPRQTATPRAPSAAARMSAIAFA
jgi:hypothetical protein